MIVDTTPTRTVGQQLAQTDRSFAYRPSPIAPIDPVAPPGFLEAAWLSFKTNSITGSGGQAIGHAIFGVGGKRDSDFDPYDLWTDEFSEKYPFMDRHFDSGRVLDIPNAQSFYYFLARQQEDYNDRARLGRGSFLGTMAGAIGPDAGLYAIAGGGAVRGVAPFKAMSSEVAAWLQTGSVAGRVAKGAALGTVAVSNEGVLHFINPDRNVDEAAAFRDAAVFGAVLGGLIPAGGKLLGAGREAFINTAWGRRLQARTRDSITHAKLSDLATIAKQSDDELDTLAAETPTGTRVITPLKHEGNKAKIAAVDAKFADAGYKLEVREHPDQAYFTAQEALGNLDGAYGVSIVDGAVRFADPDMLEPVIKGPLGKFGSMLSSLLPSGRMRRMPSGLARLFNATLFDDAALTVGNLFNAVDHEKIVSAEAIKPAVHVLAVETQKAISGAFDGHWRTAGAKPITGTLSDGTQVQAKRHGGYTTFRSMVVDAKRQMSENARGATHPLQFDPAVLEAAKQVAPYSRAMLDRLELAGMAKGERALAAAQKELTSLQAAQKAVAGEMDSHLSAAPQGPAAKAVNPSRSTPGFKKAYQKHVAALEAEVSVRGKFITRIEAENAAKFDDPDYVGPRPAPEPELKKRRPNAKIRKRAYKLAKQELQAKIDAGVAAANRAIDEHAVKRGEIQGRLDESSAAAKVKEAETAQLQDFVDFADNYLARRWLKHKIEGNKADFTGKLISQWKKYRERDYRTDKLLTERPIIAEALDRLDVDDRKLLRGITDESLISDADLAARYNAGVDEYFQASADKVYDELTDLDNTHGVPVVIKTPDSLKGRVLKIDETVFRDYLDQDIQSIIGHYDQQLAGRIAVNTAIQRTKEVWTPIVQEKLGAKFDPSQPLTVDHIIEAVNRDFDDKLNAAVTAGNTKKADAIRTARKDMGLIVDRKVSELMGRPPISTGGDAAESGWRALGRAALRMPYMAYMGLQTVTNLMDLAGLVIINGLDSRKISMLASQFGKHDGFLPTMSRRGLEAMESAIDQTRQMHLMEVFENPLDSAPPTTAFGKFGASVDRGTAFAASKFGQITGINWLNRTTRRMAGHLVLDLVVDGAKKMSKAAKLMDVEKLDQATAFHRVGLAAEDAHRISRLGFNAERSAQLLDVLSRHAVNVDGARPWADLDGFLSFNGHVNPEYHAWHKASPELFDRFVAAINSEVNNIIVTPKLGSRPFMNARWMGRALNQFWGFAYAWSNQAAIVAGQRPAGQQAAYLLSMVGLGALADGIHNHISGRRSFDETAGLWADPEKSMAMLYGAIDRSGALGWLSRPLGIADKEGFGPGAIFKGDGVSSRYLGNVKGRLGYFSPVGDWADRLMAGTIGNRGEARSWHLLRGTLPYQNLIHLQGVYRATKDMGLANPIGPGYGIDLFPLPTKPEHELNRPDRPPEP